MKIFLSSAFILLLSSTTIITTTHAQSLEKYENVCGDCWCSYANDPTITECPAVGDGIQDTFPSNFHRPYATFHLDMNESEIPRLLDAKGKKCYPFADQLGQIDRYPTSELEQCVRPAEGGFCAYVYDEADTQCRGRKYQMKNYATREEAEAEGELVQIVHGGGCGVCSNAQDMAAYIDRIFDLQDDTILCASSYVVSQDVDARFPALVDCFAQVVGFTNDCALIWAHRVAANADKCALECAGDLELNGPAPQCELGTCLDCAKDFQGEFDILSGKTYVASGLVDAVARPCSDYVRVTYDPCVGGVEPFDFENETDDDDSSSATTTTATGTLSALALGLFANIF